MLRVLDRYPLQVETKGGSVYAGWKLVILTSNESPSMWYPEFGQEYETSPLHRRLEREHGSYVRNMVSRRGTGKWDGTAFLGNIYQKTPFIHRPPAARCARWIGFVASFEQSAHPAFGLLQAVGTCGNRHSSRNGTSAYARDLAAQYGE